MVAGDGKRWAGTARQEEGSSGIPAAAMSADAARKQRRKAAARNMKKRNLQSAAEARAATEEDVVGEAPAEADRAMRRLSAAIEKASTGGRV